MAILLLVNKIFEELLWLLLTFNSSNIIKFFKNVRRLRGGKSYTLLFAMKPFTQIIFKYCHINYIGHNLIPNNFCTNNFQMPSIEKFI